MSRPTARPTTRSTDIAHTVAHTTVSPDSQAWLSVIHGEVISRPR
jgi:hypothetical protein